MQAIISFYFLAICGLAAAASDGVLFGLSSSVGLIKVDPVTGKTSQVGEPLPREAQAQNLACVDPAAGMYYLIGFNLTDTTTDLLGLSLKTGQVERTIKLPFQQTAFVGVGQAVDVDPTNGEVFVTGLQSDGLHHLYRVNPRTGTMKYLAKIGDINVLGGAHGYDVANEIVWLQYAVNTTGKISFDLFGFDGRNGGQKYHYVEDPMNSIDTLDFDAKHNRMVGFGFNVTTEQRTVIEFHSETGKFKTLATIDEYEIINGDIATFDSKDGQLFGMFQKAGNSSAPFDVIAVDISTGQVLTHPKICDNPALCPWSLEFVPNQN